MVQRMKRISGGWRIGLGSALLVAVGFVVGTYTRTNPVAAQQKTVNPIATPATTVPSAPKRAVAYIYDNIPITYEEFGNYLIENYWKDHLDLFVKKRIIDMECEKEGISVTPQEIDAVILDDCKNMKVNLQEFVKNILKTRYRKTLNEWRNDVIKPRLLLAKLCTKQVDVSEDDLKKMFENKYGEKAVVKIVLWPLEQREIAHKSYGRLRGDPNADAAAQEAAWNSVATKQPDANLAATAGAVDPIGRHSGPQSARIEQIAFGLKIGEISPVIEVPNLGHLVVRRVGTIPPDKSVTFEKARDPLRKEVVDRKVEQEIPKKMTELLAKAKPNILLTSVYSTDQQSDSRR